MLLAGLQTPRTDRQLSSADVDAYLKGLDEPKRATLEALRACILDAVPSAEQGIAYGAPAFKVDGKAVAGFAAFKDHLSYLPHSGAVLAELAAEIAQYEVTKGSLKFSVEKPLPSSLVEALVAARLRELGIEHPRVAG